MREQYLKLWNQNSYPPAMGKYLSPKEAEKFIGGRFRIGARVFQIEKDSILLSWEKALIHFKLNPVIEFAPGMRAVDVLRAGDLVECTIWKDNDARTMTLEALSLLVPARGENPFPVSEFSILAARNWQDFLSAIREYFVGKDFIELRTPTLVPSPGLEPHLDPFKTQFEMGSTRREYYLPTSPEFHLKKALVQGFPRIFEFKECFRNGEISDHHQPEFLMLEWYRAFSEMEVMMRDVAYLVDFLQDRFHSTEALPVSVITMEDVFQREFGFKLTPQTTQKEILVLAIKEGLDVSNDESFDDIFMRIFVERIEPHLGRKGPVILYHFPPSQAALARLTTDGWADRFELFWKGLEIANAFHELNNPDEQRRRFKEDQKKKLELGKPVVPVDEEFLKALDYGMPPAVGIALGVERLFMAIFGLDKLSETRLFPVSL